ncbi:MULTISPECIES: sodium:proton antiporter NhaD [Methylococcus]|uniref:Sodium:proton antiporter NhaD n=1 Tax=Methylococcus capsulatus TaxID=414 RepID=A0ABZ2F4V4_METCP|nr:MULTISPECIES: sodium:proton antiporter NhaD [Methylococcus]MDF9391775.1 sodium:proton antiporter [Methylococcus capsulatus]
MNRRSRKSALPLLGLLVGLPSVALGNADTLSPPLDLTQHWAGYFSLVVMVSAYAAAMLEEVTHLRKSKPMLLGAALVWFAISLVYRRHGQVDAAVTAFASNLLAYSELLLFIMVSMTYLNVMEDMRVFNALRIALVRRRLGYRSLFWVTGILVFFIACVINGLTAGLLMGVVVVAVGRNSPRFVSLACINIVVATNAGGSFSPLGGISTLFVWQKGMLQFTQFFTLFVPCLVNFLVPALAMHFALPRDRPLVEAECVVMQRGAGGVVFLFGVTIGLAVFSDMYLHLPPAAGMMAGLSLLQFFTFYLRKTSSRIAPGSQGVKLSLDEPDMPDGILETQRFDIFEKVGRLEWDTLLFFYGAMMGIGGLGFIGYLDAVSAWLYGQHSATLANVLIGLSSAFVDNGTLMFAVLSMHPELPEGQWLLVTLTLGVGGSLLAIGSAPGIALLGMTRGQYSFSSHLKWCPVILLGYFAAIGAHLIVNSRFF